MISVTHGMHNILVEATLPFCMFESLDCVIPTRLPRKLVQVKILAQFTVGS